MQQTLATQTPTLHYIVSDAQMVPSSAKRHLFAFGGTDSIVKVSGSWFVCGGCARAGLSWVPYDEWKYTRLIVVVVVVVVVVVA